MVDKLQNYIPHLLLLAVMFVVFSPQSLDAIDNYAVVTQENVSQIADVGRLGRGIATHLDWHPNGKIVAFGGGWGVWLLDEGFGEIAHFTDIPKTQDIAWYPNENVLATLHDDAINIWEIDDTFSTKTLIRTLPVNLSEIFYEHPLECCMAWSTNGQIIGIGTQPVTNRIFDPGEWGDENRPSDARKIELYDSISGELLSIHDTELEHRLNVRCRYGTISPDGGLQTYFQDGYLAGFYYVSLFVTRDFDSDPIAEYTLTLSDTYAMDWHPSGDYITIIHRYDILNLSWDDLKGTYFDVFNGYIDTLDWSATGDYLLANNKHTPAVYLWQRNDSSEQVFEQISVTLVGDGIESGSVWWGPTEDTLITYTAEYGYERYDLIAVATGEQLRRISRVWSVTRDTFGEDASPTWNADLTRYALFDERSNEIIIAGFASEPETITWDNEIARYVIGANPNGAKRLAEIEYPIEPHDILGIHWQGDKLRIAIGEAWSSVEYYLMNPDTGELSETVMPTFPVVVADWSRQDIFDANGVGTVDYDLTIRHPITGESLASHTEIEHPYAPILEAGQSISASAVHPEQPLIAVAVKGGVNFYSLDDGVLLHAVSTESDIAALDWDPSGEILAAGSMDGTVYLFGVTL